MIPSALSRPAVKPGAGGPVPAARPCQAPHRDAGRLPAPRIAFRLLHHLRLHCPPAAGPGHGLQRREQARFPAVHRP